MEKKKKNIFGRILGKKKLLSLLFIITLIGFGVWKFAFSGKEEKIESTQIKKGSVLQELVLSGEIDADEYVKFTFPTSGKIAWVGVKEGDWAKEGQALSKLDTIYLNAAYQRARADLRSAEATVQKIHDDVKNHNSDETFTQKEVRTVAEVAKDKAYEALIQALDNLKNSTLISPFSGLVTYVAHPFSGVNVIYTETQFEIINPKTLYFDVSADQSEVVDLLLGQNVVIVLDSLPDEKLEGEIDFISYTPKAGETGTVYKIKVKFLKDNFDTNRYRIGMNGDAKFILRQKDDVLYVPPKFIKFDSKGKFLRLGKKNNKVYIETGVEGEERVEVIGNISEG